MRNTERARLRRRAGLTQHELGKLVGKSPTAISLWETGQVELPAADVERIAHVLQMEITNGPQVSNARQIAEVLTGATA